MPVQKFRATQRRRSGTVTFREFCERTAEDQKADLIDGVIYMASPDNTEANDLFMWLGSLLEFFVEERELGEVFGSRVACRLDDKNGPEPDIVFIRKDQLHRVERSCIKGPADLAVEIVSQESVERDYEKKRRLYARFGFDEYWIVDEELERVTAFRLDAKGKYRELRPRKGELHSDVLRGFWLKPAWLWQQPRPKKLAVLAEILSRSAS